MQSSEATPKQLESLTSSKRPQHNGIKQSNINTPLGSHSSLNMQGLAVKMNFQFVLGTNQNETQSANIYVSDKDELIYYLNNMFVKYNLATKNYKIFYVENSAVSPILQQNVEDFENQSKIDRIKQDIYSRVNYSNDKLILTKYFPCETNSLLAVLKKIDKFYYLCLFWSETGNPATQFRISSSPYEIYTNFTFHSKKGYIYLLYKHINIDTDLDPNHGKYQYLKVLEIPTPTSQPSTLYQTTQKFPNQKQSIITPKQKVLLNCCIKKTGGGVHDLSDLIVGEDSTQIYLYGSDYFRQWRLSFHEKSMKQSNYRNVERNIKKQKIVNIFWVKEHLLGNKTQNNLRNSKSLQSLFFQNPRSSQNEKKINYNFLIIITQYQALFVRNNELLHKTLIPMESSIHRAQKQTAELILEKSLNQIYKTKFRVQNSIPTEQDEHQPQPHQETREIKNSIKLTAASNTWSQLNKQSDNIPGIPDSTSKQYRVVKFCGTLDSNKIFIYKIFPDFSIKIESCLKSQSYEEIKKINSEEMIGYENIKNISASYDGSLLLFTDEKFQNYIHNHNQDFESTDIDPLYNIGHGHTCEILSISSPEINHHLTSISKDGVLKIWNYNQKERCLIIDTKFKLKPVKAIIHPSGFLLIVNFGHQIKIYAIVSNELEEIVSTKTNDYCSHIQFCKANNFLVANQKSVIKIYDPMTLHMLGKLQPEDLRLEFRKIRVSDNGEYIVFQYCNQKVYRKTINSILGPQLSLKTKLQENYERDEQKSKLYRNVLCHKQSQQYTCFYYDFGFATKHTSSSSTSEAKNSALSSTNIFVGFTKNKFMAIYSNYGEDLVAEFPVINGVYVTNFCLTDHTIFLGTNRGTILTYSWPILQSNFELAFDEPINNPNIKTAHYKLPKPTQQFLVWRNYTPITTLYKIPNKHQLVVGGVQGLIGFVEYSFHKNGNEVPDNQTVLALSNERKRMIEAMNNIRFMKLADIDKIIKLIEKTQSDIQKIDHEIQCQKERKNNLLAEEERSLQNTMNKRKNAYIDQRSEKFVQQERELKYHEIEYAKKKRQLENTKKFLEKDYKAKADHQKKQIQNIKCLTQQEKKNYKERILRLIDQHKENIKKLKQNNLTHIKTLQKQFENQIAQNFKQEEQIAEIKQVNVEEQAEIHAQVLKVQELQSDIAIKQVQFSKISSKADNAKKQDEQAQKIFEKNLQKYNQNRYQNLILHSELLKMQNQLYQRKQILSKKDEIIKLAYQQKQINETYKQFVSGTIINIQSQKQNAYKSYVKKQYDLRMLFEELTLEINKSENKKLRKEELKRAIRICERESKQKQQIIKQTIEKLNSLKNYLLVQGVSFDTEQKKIYQEQQKLLSTIHWLEKRFRMNCINEKKITQLKQSGVSQIINQNKNLLQQCNQLRQQGIIFQNQIQYLSRKLAEANKIIQFEKKIKNQNNVLHKQSQQLNQIRKMFKNELDRANEDLQEEI